MSVSPWLELAPLPSSASRPLLWLTVPLSCLSLAPEPPPACVSREPGVSPSWDSQGLSHPVRAVLPGAPAGCRALVHPAPSSLMETSAPALWFTAVPVPSWATHLHASCPCVTLLQTRALALPAQTQRGHPHSPGGLTLLQ